MKILKTFLVISTVLALIGCAPPPEPQEPVQVQEVQVKKLPKKLEPFKPPPEEVGDVQGVEWHKFSPKMFSEAGKEQKIIMLYLHASKCEPCVVFERATLSDPLIGMTLNKYFFPALVPDDMEEQVMTAFEAKMYPSVVFLLPNGRHLLTINGFAPPSKFKKVIGVIVNHFYGEEA